MVRVRFAPSPTGYLHIGGARTALFNYLFARHNNGKFILRIEDTDQERSTKESEAEILEALKWLGLDWDEGPGKSADDSMYYQTKRLPVYHKHIESLLASGKAYKCFCTKDELDAKRKAAESAKTGFKYDGTCAHLTPEQVKAKEDAKLPYTVRLKIPKDGETVVSDLVRGEVKVANATLDDIIIMRADGMPIYNFVVVVDDADMGITHVIRGEDHLSNTPKQIHIYNALGIPLPQFAHIPLILGADKSKLSKRHGEVSVLRYRDNGYLPQSVVNYLALLGWSPESEDTVFTMEQLIKIFSLERVHKSGAVFDNSKMMYINGVNIRSMQADELTGMCMPFLLKSGLVTEEQSKSDYEKIKHIVLLQQEKMKTLAELPELSAYFFRDEITMTDEAKKVWEKNSAERGRVLEVLKKIIEETGTDKAKVEERIRIDMEAAGLKSKVFMHVIRVTLSGTTMGPGLFDMIETLGREKCLARIAKAGA
ncbi:MAG: glutamate--tRNA ligase [Spirochaetia bacterium]|nr:glutamate--tRNA ligase [Spirochaetia bacterium]